MAVEMRGMNSHGHGAIDLRPNFNLDFFWIGFARDMLGVAPESSRRIKQARPPYPPEQPAPSDKSTTRR